MRIAVILIIVLMAYGQHCQSMSMQQAGNYHNPVCQFLESL